MAPAVILVAPQMGENIGAAARAMANFGLGDLRLVAPRDGWPNPRAVPMAANAGHIIEGARVFGTLAEAAADLTHLYATTGRRHDMVKPVITPEAAAAEARAAGQGAGFVFGPERSGLLNDDIALARAIVTIPTDPQFFSLNLAQAVLILGYAWWRGGMAAEPVRAEPAEGQAPATLADLTGLFTHLERELVETGFLYPPHKAPSMIRNLRNMWTRANLTEQDVRTLRGVVTALAGKRALRRPSDDAS